ncbi:NnrS family protein [Thioclava sp. IC9]|uniref:NnrS family protein n=1 Tax=Thioclava sp. IC9 TaxID=1973007 RepID=UPI000B545CBF|nr:NnrS family protein [Thioclava sp. IC9]OWY06237.1 short-chain dehydrogenase [Thioclava sp. IC9]
MAMSSAEQMRRWQGPALLSGGFRPFFFFGAVWAALAMALWVPALTGLIALPTRLDPVSWHAHAFLFGYLGAAIAGFLLTAVPNWTGRLPVVGWPLLGLVTLWALGRLGLLASAHLPFALVACIDLAFPLALGGVVLREILAGKNWRNLPVLGLLGVFTLADLLFLIEAARGGYAADGIGMRLGLAAVLMMVALIGGRIIPSFTRNWLVKENHPARPAPPMQRFDKLAMLVAGAALLAWVISPETRLTAALLLATAVLHLARLWRWKGGLTLRAPILFVLHLAYACLPLGALALGFAILFPAALAPATAMHLWTAGALGGMTLAVMSRASLGHTGRPLEAGTGTVAVYAALFVAMIARLLAGWLALSALYSVSGVAWCGAFLGFAILYAPVLWQPRRREQ